MEYTDLLVVKEYKFDEGIGPSAIRLPELHGIYSQEISHGLPSKTAWTGKPLIKGLQCTILLFWDICYKYPTFMSSFHWNCKDPKWIYI